MACHDDPVTTTEFRISQTWTGNDGRGTSSGDFDRSGELAADGSPTIPTAPPGAADGGWSPEALLLGAVSECQMLWYLHLCARNGIVVESYRDTASGTLAVEGSRGAMTGIHLDARVTISAGDAEQAAALFEVAGERCYIARSLAEPVRHTITVEQVPVSPR